MVKKVEFLEGGRIKVESLDSGLYHIMYSKDDSALGIYTAKTEEEKKQIY